jgi:hypothetical protein
MNHLAPNLKRELTDVTDVSVYALLDDYDRRQVMITGFTAEPIRLAPDDALRMGLSLQKLSGLTPEKPPQQPSEATRQLAGQLRDMIDGSESLIWDPDAIAPTQDVLRVLTAEFARRAIPEPSKTALGRALRLLGGESLRTNGERFYVGLHVTQHDGFEGPAEAGRDAPHPASSR